MSATVVAVIGGGVAGCAAAVGAARAGARVVLIEPRRFLGGIAVAAEHRTICGLAPLDASSPALLEPAATAAWVEAVATGEPARRGRVWLWPTTPAALADGLARRLASAGVEVRLGCSASAIVDDGADHADDSVRLRVVGVASAAADGGLLRCDALIDASGAGTLAGWIALPTRPPRQWGSCRAVARIGGIDGLAARVRALARMQAAIGGSAALALEPLAPPGPLADQCWQVSIDVAPEAEAAPARAAVERAVAAAGGELLAHTISLGRRDEGGAAGGLSLAELFATAERGLCWAAWPREEHMGSGVAWTYPPRDRYGVPASAVRMPGAPSWAWCIGKGMPVSPEAASALRVTGTCLALGDAAGRRAAGA